MESITESQNANETSASSLGLGAALAVAYDLTEDPNFSQPSYIHPETNSVPLASTGPQTGVIVSSKNPYYPALAQAQPVRYHAGDPYWAVSGCPQPPQQPPHISVSSATALPMTAYLNPIPVSSPPSCPRGPENGSFFLQSVSQPPPPVAVLAPTAAETISYGDGGPASESTLSTDSMLSVRSDTIPAYPPTSEMGYTIKSVPQTIMPNTGHHGGSGVVTNTTNSSSSHNSSTSGSRRHEDQRQAAVPSSGSDDGLYELSEEDVKEIDDMLAQNPQVTSSRNWKYYIETNEWTRATCALMACLFSRDQMANSTVLGRGGSQRERLPTNLVAYVVTKMRRRFNQSAATVRARMAQKCKDERRFGRVLPSGAIATNSERSHSNSSSAASTISSSTLTSSAAAATTTGNLSRQSTLNRRRSAAYPIANAPPAKNSRYSLAPQPPPQPLPLPSAVPTQLASPPAMLTSLPSEAYAPPPTANSVPATAPVVHDPPVILASAPEMAS